MAIDKRRQVDIAQYHFKRHPNLKQTVVLGISNEKSDQTYGRDSLPDAIGFPLFQ